MEENNRLEEDCSNTLVARLKVTLSDAEPEVLQRFVAPLETKLNRLDGVIWATIGWTNTINEFRAGGVGWGVPLPEYHDDGPLPANKTSLLGVLEDVSTDNMNHIHDDGDN